MSVYSTLNITRSKALEIWRSRTMENPTDSELETYMDGYLESRLCNCRIVADDDEYNNDEKV